MSLTPKRYNAQLADSFGMKFSDETSAEKIAIGKVLRSSPSFPPLHTVRAAFTAYGVPPFSCVNIYLYNNL